MKVAAVIVDRANYGRLKPLLSALQNDAQVELSIVCCGSTLLKRFHQPVNEINNTFHVTHRIYHEVEGSVEATEIHSMALLMPQLVNAFQQLNPDFVIIIGDRFEALAVATVAAIMKIAIVHVQGGEHSGNIDDSIRNAITKLAHYHLPATNDACRVLTHDLSEFKSSIIGVGCPSADLVKDVKIDTELLDTILCVYHPEDCVNNSAVVTHLLNTFELFKKRVMMFWPNIDAGSEDIVKAIRRYIQFHEPHWLTMMVNVDPIQYLTILRSVKGCVGNSSSFVRDASFFGTPVIIVGDRQVGRIVTENVDWLRLNELDGLYERMLRNFTIRFQPSNYYGSAGISEYVVSRLKDIYANGVTRLKVSVHV